MDERLAKIRLLRNSLKYTKSNVYNQTDTLNTPKAKFINCITSRNKHAVRTIGRCDSATAWLTQLPVSTQGFGVPAMWHRHPTCLCWACRVHQLLPSSKRYALPDAAQRRVVNAWVTHSKTYLSDMIHWKFHIAYTEDIINADNATVRLGKSVTHVQVVSSMHNTKPSICELRALFGWGILLKINLG